MKTQLSMYLKEPVVRTFELKDDGTIPNNPELDLIVYEHALDLPEDDSAGFVERLLDSHRWEGAWRNGVYDYHHYHSTAHEVLVVYRGSATLQLGGERGVILDLKAGDAVLIPAGTGHKNRGSTSDFAVVGAYPMGQEPDLNRGEPGERPKADENIRQTPVPPSDPLFGPTGPMLDYWKVNA